MRQLFQWTCMLIVCTLIGSGCSTKQQSNSSFGKKEYEQIISANNQLGFELLHELQSDENVLLSPTSVFLALSMVYNGADGKTKDEIAKTMHIEDLDVQQLNQSNASFLQLLSKRSDAVHLAIANSIWLNEMYAFQQPFQQAVEDYYNAEAVIINPADASKQINHWVSKQTNGNIKDMVNEQLAPNVVMILLNALYFKGDWTYPFPLEKTMNKPFTSIDGAKRQVPMMVLNKELYYFENNELQAVELPYGKGDFRMQVFLPKEDQPFHTFFDGLTAAKWGELTTQFTKKDGTVLLPKFEVEREMPLNEPLLVLGMQSAFSNANFSKLVTNDGSLSIDEVKQKTYLKVDESGTEAAAATSITMTESASIVKERFHMNINRPFIFTIIHEPSNAILFLGTIGNPTAIQL